MLFQAPALNCIILSELPFMNRDLPCGNVFLGTLVMLMRYTANAIIYHLHINPFTEQVAYMFRKSYVHAPSCSSIYNFAINSSSSMALQPGVGLGLHYNTSPNLSIPCSISPSVYSHLSQVRRHIIQPSRFWSSSASCTSP
jgi:hypothetical protein